MPDFPGVAQWEVMTSPVDVQWNIHRGEVKTSGNLWWKWMSTGLHAFGRGCRLLQSINTTGQQTE